MPFTEEISILFEEPFWIALFEHHDGQFYSVAKVVIDTSEPLGIRLLDFFEHLDHSKLLFTSPVEAEKSHTGKTSFKKQLHKNKHQQEGMSKYVFTKAQALLKQQHSELNSERKKEARMKQQLDIQQKFELKQLKKKERHKGH
jgi:hypothetical protein